MEDALVVPTPQTNLSYLRAHQQPGVRGEGNPPRGGWEIQSTVIALCKVSGKSVWPPGRTRPGPNLTCHLSAMGPWPRL